MEKYEIEALVQNCIDAYNWIKEQIGELDTRNITIEDVKRVVKIPGYEYLGAFGEIFRTHETISRLQEGGDDYESTSGTK